MEGLASLPDPLLPLFVLQLTNEPSAHLWRRTDYEHENMIHRIKSYNVFCEFNSLLMLHMQLIIPGGD